jgi:ketosteroid isomerase-like protein
MDEHTTTTPAVSTNAADVVRSYCDAWMASDTVAVLSHYHADLTLHWPGSHHLAGQHVGQQASLEALMALQAATNRVPSEIVDVMVGRRGVAVNVIEKWTRSHDDGSQDTSMNVSRALVFTVEDGLLRTCHVYESAQPAIDEWLAR